MRVAILAIAAAMAIGAAQGEPAKLCKFTYTDHIRDKVVAPVLKKAAGKNAGNYDLNHPRLDTDDRAGGARQIDTPISRVLIVFVPTKITLASIDIQIIIDPCNSEILATTCSLSRSKTFPCPPSVKLPPGAMCMEAVECGGL